MCKPYSPHPSSLHHPPKEGRDGEGNEDHSPWWECRSPAANCHCNFTRVNMINDNVIAAVSYFCHMNLWH